MRNHWICNSYGKLPWHYLIPVLINLRIRSHFLQRVNLTVVILSVSELERSGDVWVVESAINSTTAEMDVPFFTRNCKLIREANLQLPNIFNLWQRF